MGTKVKDRLIELQGHRTAEQFGKDLGVSRQTINYWLKGERKPSAEIIKTICEKESVSADWLLGFDVPRNPNTDIQMIADYTGLSEGSIDNLHILKHGSENCYSPNEKALAFVNMALESGVMSEGEYKDEIKKYPGFGEMKTTAISVFEDMYRLIIPIDKQPDSYDEAYIEIIGDNSGDIFSLSKQEFILCHAEKMVRQFIDELRSAYNPAGHDETRILEKLLSFGEVELQKLSEQNEEIREKLSSLNFDGEMG